MEKVLVRTFLCPILFNPEYSDFFFGSICFLTNWLYHIRSHISFSSEYNEFVHLIALDFSKAFDTVRHFTLMSK